MNAPLRNTPPEWACNCDSTADLTDCLQEVDRAAAEEGHECTGHFDHAEGLSQNERHEDVKVIVAVLQGISIDRGLARITYYGEKDARRILGDEAIDRNENAQSEAQALARDENAADERAMDALDFWGRN